MTDLGGAASPRPLSYLREEAQEALDGGYSYVSTISPSEVLALIAAQEAPALEGLRAALERAMRLVHMANEHEGSWQACQHGVCRSSDAALTATPPTPAEPPRPWDPSRETASEVEERFYRAEARPPEGLDAATLAPLLHDDPSLCRKHSPNGHPRWMLRPLCVSVAERLAARLSAGGAE